MRESSVQLATVLCEAYDPAKDRFHLNNCYILVVKLKHIFGTKVYLLIRLGVRHKLGLDSLECKLRKFTI